MTFNNGKVMTVSKKEQNLNIQIKIKIQSFPNELNRGRIYAKANRKSSIFCRI